MASCLLPQVTLLRKNFAAGLGEERARLIDINTIDGFQVTPRFRAPCLVPLAHLISCAPSFCRPTCRLPTRCDPSASGGGNERLNEDPLQSLDVPASASFSLFYFFLSFPFFFLSSPSSFFSVRTFTFSAMQRTRFGQVVALETP